jgi:hypothetical protein
MAVVTLQSTLVPIKISTDGGTTKKSIVCKKSWTLNSDNSPSEEQTDCGVLIAPGINKWSFDVEGVLNSTPGGSEVSAKDLLGLSVNGTIIDIYLDEPSGTGTVLYATGKAYITNFKVTGTSGNLVTFSATITGSGILDVTP